MRFEVTEKTWIVASNVYAINSDNEPIFNKSEGIVLNPGDSIDVVGDIEKFDDESKWKDYCAKNGIDIISMDGGLSATAPKLPENPFIITGPRAVK